MCATDLDLELEFTENETEDETENEDESEAHAPRPASRGRAPGVAWGQLLSPSGPGSRAPGPSRCAGAGTRTSPPSRPPTPTAV